MIYVQYIIRNECFECYYSDDDHQNDDDWFMILVKRASFILYKSVY